MSGQAKKPKKGEDSNQLAAAVLAMVAKENLDERATEAAEPEKNPAAVALGRLGGLKGGRARAEKLSPERRREIARQAAAVRWSADR